MTVEKLIEVLQGVKNKEQRVVTLARKGDKDDTFRGISRIKISRDVLGDRRIVLSDG